MICLGAFVLLSALCANDASSTSQPAMEDTKETLEQICERIHLRNATRELLISLGVPMRTAVSRMHSVLDVPRCLVTLEIEMTWWLTLNTERGELDAFTDSREAEAPEGWEDAKRIPEEKAVSVALQVLQAIGVPTARDQLTITYNKYGAVKGKRLGRSGNWQVCQPYFYRGYPSDAICYVFVDAITGGVQDISRAPLPPNPESVEVTLNAAAAERIARQYSKSRRKTELLELRVPPWLEIASPSSSDKDTSGITDNMNITYLTWRCEFKTHWGDTYKTIIHVDARSGAVVGAWWADDLY